MVPFHCLYADVSINFGSLLFFFMFLIGSFQNSFNKLKKITQWQVNNLIFAGKTKYTFNEFTISKNVLNDKNDLFTNK